MGKRYARREDVKELTKVVTKLADLMTEFARWRAYDTIKENPFLPQKTRNEILEHSKGHITHTLYKQLFRAYPLKPM